MLTTLSFAYAFFQALSFETYLCALVIPPAYTYWKSSKRTFGNKVLRILIRDSLIWYISSATFMFLNALAWTTTTVSSSTESVFEASR